MYVQPISSNSFFEIGDLVMFVQSHLGLAMKYENAKTIWNIGIIISKDSQTNFCIVHCDDKIFPVTYDKLKKII